MSDTYETIGLERAGEVALLTLARPQRLNAINRQMLGELQEALDEVERDDALRVLMVKGAGGNFSSGFDLKEQMEARPSGEQAWREILDRDFAGIMRFWHLRKQRASGSSTAWSPPSGWKRLPLRLLATSP